MGKTAKTTEPKAKAAPKLKGNQNVREDLSGQFAKEELAGTPGHNLETDKAQDGVPIDLNVHVEDNPQYPQVVEGGVAIDNVRIQFRGHPSGSGEAVMEITACGHVPAIFGGTDFDNALAYVRGHLERQQCDCQAWLDSQKPVEVEAEGEGSAE